MICAGWRDEIALWSAAGTAARGQPATQSQPERPASHGVLKVTISNAVPSLPSGKRPTCTLPLSRPISSASAWEEPHARACCGDVCDETQQIENSVLMSSLGTGLEIHIGNTRSHSPHKQLDPRSFCAGAAPAQHQLWRQRLCAAGRSHRPAAQRARHQQGVEM